MTTRTLRTSLFGLGAMTLLALPTAALAQPNPDDWGGSGGSTGGTLGETPVTTAAAPTAEPAPAAEGEAKWGLGTTFPTGGDGVYANFLKAMSGGENWLDLGVSLRIDKAGDGADTVFGLGVRGGYRMFRAQMGRVRPYVEPFAGIDIGTLDDVGASLSLVAGARGGVDFTVLPQFTLGTSIGLGASFSDDFNNIHIGTFQSSIDATFWW